MGKLAERLAKIAEISQKEHSSRKQGGSARSAPPIYVAAGNEERMAFGRLPTGIPNVDLALGGGFPRGATSLYAGPEGVGKTHGLLCLIAENQRLDPDFIALWANLESNQFPLDQAMQAGVDLERLLICDAKGSGEETFGLVMAFLWEKETRIARDIIDLVVVDSITAAVPEAELTAYLKEGLGKDTVGRQAAMLSKLLRIANGTGALGKAALILVDQVRVDMQYGGRILPGGKAVHHYPKIILILNAPKSGDLGYIKVNPGKTNEEVIGHHVHVTVDKNNTGRGKPHAKVVYPVRYLEGIDLAGPLVQACVTQGIIHQTSAAWFALPLLGPDGQYRLPTLDAKGKVVTGDKINGRIAVDTLVRETPALHEYLKQALVDVMEGQTADLFSDKTGQSSSEVAAAIAEELETEPEETV